MNMQQRPERAPSHSQKASNKTKSAPAPVLSRQEVQKQKGEDTKASSGDQKLVLGHPAGCWQI